jgi:hypothetical protein
MKRGRIYGDGPPARNVVIDDRRRIAGDRRLPRLVNESVGDAG